MKPVELYARVRYACQVEGLSQRETARRFGIDPKTVRKMLAFSVPPGYRRTVTWWVMSAVKDETRRSRLAKVIESAARGQRVGLLAPAKAP